MCPHFWILWIKVEFFHYYQWDRQMRKILNYLRYRLNIYTQDAQWRDLYYFFLDLFFLQGQQDHRKFSHLKLLKVAQTVIFGFGFVCWSTSHIHQPDHLTSVKITAETDICNGNYCIPGPKSGILCIVVIMPLPRSSHQIFFKFRSYVPCTKVQMPINFGSSVIPFMATRGQMCFLLYWLVSQQSSSHNPTSGIHLSFCLSVHLSVSSCCTNWGYWS